MQSPAAYAALQMRCCFVPLSPLLYHIQCCAVLSHSPDVVVAGADELEQALHWVLPQHASPWQVRRYCSEASISAAPLAVQRCQVSSIKLQE
jgi:hypothetical protein